MPAPRGVWIYLGNYFKNWVSKSMGSGKLMVELFSAEMVDRVHAKTRKKPNDYTLRLGKRLQESTRATHVTWETSLLEGRNLNDVAQCITWRYRNCRAAGDWLMTIAASLRAVEVLYSPSAAMTLARPARDASASVVMAGARNVHPHVAVAARGSPRSS